jgi:3',5'-cyclic AMP phosphodiesterase CpdA
VKGIVRDSTLEWIESVLSDARKQGKTVVALQHHPFYDPREKTKKVISGDKKLMALYAEYGVAVVVAGHEHYYAVERGKSFPMVLVPNAADSPEKSLSVKLVPGKVSVALDPYGFGR